MACRERFPSRETLHYGHIQCLCLRKIHFCNKKVKSKSRNQMGNDSLDACLRLATTDIHIDIEENHPPPKIPFRRSE